MEGLNRSCHHCRSWTFYFIVRVRKVVPKMVGTLHFDEVKLMYHDDKRGFAPLFQLKGEMTVEEDLHLSTARDKLKKSARRNGIILIFLIVFNLALAITSMTEEYPIMSNVIIFWGLTVFCIYKLFNQWRKYRAAMNVDDYIRYLNESKDNTVEELVHKTGKTDKKVCRDIRDLEKFGLVGGSSIDSSGHVGLHAFDGHSLVTTRGEKRRKEQDELLKKVVVECPSCGARKEIDPRYYTVCDYCGTKLSVE